MVKITAGRKKRLQKNDKKIQDAHEAIRPSDIALYTGHGKRVFVAETSSVFISLIWKRFTASQMSPAVYETTICKDRVQENTGLQSSCIQGSILMDSCRCIQRDDEEEEKPVDRTGESGLMRVRA